MKQGRMISNIDRERNEMIATIIDSSPVICCPHCACGSNELFLQAQTAGLWGFLDCPSCDQGFQIAHAIDEMFVRGDPWGYVMWLGCKRLTRYIRCDHGDAEYLLLPNEFDEVYKTLHHFVGGVTALGGGILVEHTAHGLVIAAVAGEKSDQYQPVDLLVTLLGRAPGQLPLRPWMRLILEARLATLDVPAIVPIHAVSAIDMFVEATVGRSDIGLSRRPTSWSKLLKPAVGQTLRELIGKRSFQRLENLLCIRNRIAHGLNYIECMPKEMRAEEALWKEDPKRLVGEGAMRPSARLAISTALEVIRLCREKVAATASASNDKIFAG